MWDIKTILKDFVETKNFQEFINHRYKDDRDIVIEKKYFNPEYNKMILQLNGINIKYLFDDNFTTIMEANEDYNIEGLSSSDIILDIGACIGGLSLSVASKVKHVYAVEPIMTERLKQNIALNNVKNITVFDCGLGKSEINLKWLGRIKKVKCKSLSEIINLCGGHIDFLKCDCEGGEWSIKPEELKGIRRIEAEIHSFKGMPQLTEFEDTLKKAGFDYKKEMLSKSLMLIHANQELKN